MLVLLFVVRSKRRKEPESDRKYSTAVELRLSNGKMVGEWVNARDVRRSD